ncbi:DUF6896 domain-containing protein [Allokutzneria oryzae]|uniref:DUF6896 domain-containing protein n=1 Tax=Allokutzneria oryzae TaxID=1378989 RepID=A0ABV5ZSB5_9PSEU
MLGLFWHRAPGDLLAFLRTEKRVREWFEGQSGVRYRGHGIGVLCLTSAGEEVDFDFEVDGAIVFDAWRVAWYCESVSRACDVGKDEIDQAMQQLVWVKVLVEARPGWYALVGE